MESLLSNKGRKFFHDAINASKRENTMNANVSVVRTAVECTSAQLSAVRNGIKGNNNSASASSTTVG